MLNRLISYRHLPIFLFLVAFALYSANLGGVSIYILDEAKNAGCAREMFERGDLVVPTFNDVLRTDKPPLHYFFMMAGYSIFGVNAWGARIFSAFFGALTILVTFLFVSKFANRRLAFWSAFVLLSSIHLSIQFHLAVPDPYLIFFFTAGVFCFYAALQQFRWRYLLAMYACIGLGTLSKGPVAIALPGLIFLLYLIFSKTLKWAVIRKLQPFIGAAIVLLIALPWYIFVGIETDGDWLRGFFLKHNLGRFTSEMEGHGGIFLVTFAFVLAGLFPFSVFVVQAAKQSWHNRKDPFTLFLLISGLSVVGFFALSSTKLPNYTVPSYPFLAILIAQYVEKAISEKRLPTYPMYLLMAISAIIVPAIFFGLKFDPALSAVNNVAWWFLPLPIGMLLALWHFRKANHTISVVATGLGSMLTATIFFLFAFPAIDRQNPVSKSLSLVKDKEVRYFERFNPAYSFALQKAVRPIAPEDFEAFFEASPDGVIISTKKKIEEIDLPDGVMVSFQSRDIFESPTTVLLTRKP